LIVIDTIDIVLRQYNISQGYLQIPCAKWDLFPSTNSEIIVKTSNGTFIMGFYVKEGHHGIGRKLKDWFNTLQHIKPGDILKIMVVERGRKYRIELIKQNLRDSKELKSLMH
jgi:hypothetical protein